MGREQGPLSLAVVTGWSSNMGGVGGQAPPAGALIKPLAAISPLRHVVGQGSRAVFPPGPVELGGPLPCAIGSGDQVQDINE